MASPSLVLTVDTEPDDQWAPPSGGRLPPLRFENTRGLRPLKEHLQALGVPVTWLTSFSVAADPRSAELLREFADDGDEIGGHLHGWETPPLVDLDRAQRPFIYEYSPDVRLAKHRSLVAAHEAAFGARPLSYRAGRWAVDSLELEHLTELGYQIDSSIPPGIDFRDRVGAGMLGPDFRGCLRASPPQPCRIGTLWEVPVSVTPAGALGAGSWGARVARLAGNRAPRRRSSRWACRALDSVGLHRLVWVRPLKHPRGLLIDAAGALVQRGAPIINVMFHSSEAFVGTSPLSRTREDVTRLYGDLTAIVHAVRRAGLVPRTLRDAVALLADDPPNAPNPLEVVHYEPTRRRLPPA